MMIEEKLNRIEKEHDLMLELLSSENITEEDLEKVKNISGEESKSYTLLKELKRSQEEGD